MKTLFQNPKLLMLGLVALMALAMLAGYQPAHAELMLAGVGGLPMVMGHTERLEAGQAEFKRLLLANLDSVEEFKTKYDSRLDTLSDEVHEVAKAVADNLLKLQRPDMGGGDSAGFSSEDRQHKQAFVGWLRSGREADLQTKSMSATSDPEGGYAVPRQLDSLLTKVLREINPMRQLARVVQAESGDFSMVHSIGGTAYDWVGEIAPIGDTDAPQFQLIKPTIGILYAQPAITQTLLEDASFDLENWLLEELAEAFGEGEGTAFITGNGVNKPTGLLTYDTTNQADGVRDANKLQYVASGASGGWAAVAPGDKLVSLVHALKPRYRAGAAWLMNSNTLAEVRQFKTSSGDYLWKIPNEAQQIGATGTLLGFPVHTCEDMPDIAASSLSIAFGNFQAGYTIVDRSSRMIRDALTLKPYVRYYTTRRVGGAVRDTRAIKLMKFSAS